MYEESSSATDAGVVTISDLNAIRALTHEARLKVINFLFASQKSATATELANGLGLSPSAMSYHLRALARWGYIRRSNDGTDGRERRWRANGKVLNIASTEGDTGPGTALLDMQVEAFRSRARSYLGKRSERIRSGETADPATVTMISETLLYLTDAQRSVISRRVFETLAEFQDLPPTGETQPMLFLWSFLPEV